MEISFVKLRSLILQTEGQSLQHSSDLAHEEQAHRVGPACYDSALAVEVSCSVMMQELNYLHNHRQDRSL